MNNDELIAEKQGIRLDIGSGEHPQPGFVGMDIQEFPGVIQWDWMNIPWCIKDETVIQAIASHVVEHVPRVMLIDGKTRWTFIEFMNEVWRVLKPGSQFAIAMPYCHSDGYFQDPTHVNPCNEKTWLYFDPEAQGGLFWQFYKPKPWKLEYISYDPAANMEVLMTKREA
jgi:SAM-dependent methyltransferase